jgi:hypothetical protein
MRLSLKRAARRSSKPRALTGNPGEERSGGICSASPATALKVSTVVPSNFNMEHREGIEPSNTGFADQRVSHFATGAHAREQPKSHPQG